MILCSAEPRIISCLPTHVINLVINDNSLEILYIYIYFFNLFFFFKGRKEGNVIFNDALDTFYLRLYDVKHMVNDHSDSEKGNPLPPHRLLFTINSKGCFICTIPKTG